MTKLVQGVTVLFQDMDMYEFEALLEEDFDRDCRATAWTWDISLKREVPVLHVDSSRVGTIDGDNTLVLTSYSIEVLDRMSMMFDRSPGMVHVEGSKWWQLAFDCYCHGETWLEEEVKEIIRICTQADHLKG